MNDTILLIEDNDQNRYLATFLLERHGYTVVSAHDGVHGIELARTVTPTLVLPDFQLPMMDGYAVACALRTLPGLHCTPIVAVTSYAMPEAREKHLRPVVTAASKNRSIPPHSQLMYRAI